MMYTIVRDLLDNCIKETPDVWEWASEVALVGGVMVNRKSGGDFFQPLSFELRRSVSVANGRPTDVYREAFGPRPDLLGYAEVAGGSCDGCTVVSPEVRHWFSNGIIESERPSVRTKKIRMDGDVHARAV